MVQACAYPLNEIDTYFDDKDPNKDSARAISLTNNAIRLQRYPRTEDSVLELIVYMSGEINDTTEVRI